MVNANDTNYERDEVYQVIGRIVMARAGVVEKESFDKPSLEAACFEMSLNPPVVLEQLDTLQQEGVPVKQRLEELERRVAEYEQKARKQATWTAMKDTLSYVPRKVGSSLASAGKGIKQWYNSGNGWGFTVGVGVISALSDNFRKCGS